MLHHCDDHITATKKDTKEDKKEESKSDATFPSLTVIAITFAMSNLMTL